MTQARILIVDDHAAVREAIRMLLVRHPEYQVCGEAATAQEAIYRSKEIAPDVILLDISLPDRSGLEALPEIRIGSPRSSILIVSQHDPKHMRPMALSLGAKGFISKTSLCHELVSAIETVLVSNAHDGLEQNIRDGRRDT
jgi:DNA-binding NarL/FixJ family response regulator